MKYVAIVLLVIMTVAGAAYAQDASRPAPTQPSADELLKAVEAERAKVTQRAPSADPAPEITRKAEPGPDPDQAVRLFRATSRRMETVDAEVNADVQRLLGAPAAPRPVTHKRTAAPVVVTGEAVPLPEPCDLASFASRLGDLEELAAGLKGHPVGDAFERLLTAARAAGRGCEVGP